MSIAVARGVKHLHRETRYRFAYAGLWVAAGLGLGVLTYLDHPVVGVLVFAAMILGSRAVKARYGGVLFDQRDSDHDRAASQRTLAILGTASAVAFPALLVLSGAGYFTWTPFAVGVASTIAAVFIIDSLLRAAISLRH